MRADDLPAGQPHVLEVHVDPRAALPAWLDELFPSSGRRDRKKDAEVFVRRMFCAGRPLDVEVTHASGGTVRGKATSERDLRLALDHGQADITIVDILSRAGQARGRYTGPHRLTISCYVFPLGSLPGELVVGIGDEVARRVRTALRCSGASMGAIRQWLLEECSKSGKP